MVSANRNVDRPFQIFKVKKSSANTESGTRLLELRQPRRNQSVGRRTVLSRQRGLEQVRRLAIRNDIAYRVVLLYRCIPTSTLFPFQLNTHH